MRFTQFTIQNYRAITGPLTIDVARNSLIPVIGVNESGKTTILQAIFAFDVHNDALNDGGRHLRDVANLYRTSSPNPRISAEVEVSRDELLSVLEALAKDATLTATAARYRRKRKSFPSRVTIVRDLKTKRYSFTTDPFGSSNFDHALASAIVGRCPYILFFDDFRDSIEERIEIVKEEGEPPSGWLAILEQLFSQTDKTLSVFNLASMEDRQRKSVLAKVKRHLNGTLTREWQNFRLDDTDALEISIDYEAEAAAGTTRHYLRLDIIETDADGDEHYFFVRDRSKGFFWFFNFVMKLEFNPKVVADDDNTIYLLDEPGSYLHASAQSKLCAKLRQLSRRNRVIYCTHSHYLLDPEHIPLSSITVADKDGSGNVQLVPIHEHKGNITERRSAFQPVVDALQIKPFLLDLTAQRIVIVEGIYDYYSLDMMRHERSVSMLPSVGADSVKFYISLMLAWRIRFVALWDNDDEGRAKRDEAERIFGAELASKHFVLLPLRVGKKRILQDLFAGNDVAAFRTKLALPTNSSFQKTITALYYSPTRTAILNDVSRETRANFEQLFDSLQID